MDVKKATLIAVVVVAMLSFCSISVLFENNSSAETTEYNSEIYDTSNNPKPVQVSSVDKLESAIEKGEPYIRLVGNGQFKLSSTITINYPVVIYSEESTYFSISGSQTMFYVEDKGTLTLAGVNSDGYITISGTPTTENARPVGIYVASGGTLNIYNGVKICDFDNSPTDGLSNDHNATAIFTKGIVNMYGGEISNNTAEFGGAIFISGGTFNLNGGKISDNTAVNGGAIRITSGEFNMNGGMISNNTATRNGGGIAASGTIDSNGEAISLTINIYSGLIQYNKATGTEDVSGNKGSGGFIHLFESANDGSTSAKWVVNITGGTYLGNSASTSNNNSGCGLGGIVSARSGVVNISNIKVEGNPSEPLARLGSVIGVTNAEINMKNCIITGVSASLKGGAVYSESSKSATSIVNCTFTYCKITGNNGYGGAICIIDSPNTYMKWNHIENCSAGTVSGIGGAMSLINTNATVDETYIKESTANKGAGIYLSNSNCIFNTVFSQNNTTTSNGGGIYMVKGSLVMNGNFWIDENTAANGGGIRIEGGTVTMNGGNISNNTVTGNGGGIAIGAVKENSGSTFIMNGGNICGNVAGNKNSPEKDKGQGSAIHLWYFSGSNGTVILNGGTISSNVSYTKTTNYLSSSDWNSHYENQICDLRVASDITASGATGLVLNGVNYSNGVYLGEGNEGSGSLVYGSNHEGNTTITTAYSRVVVNNYEATTPTVGGVLIFVTSKTTVTGDVILFTEYSDKYSAWIENSYTFHYTNNEKPVTAEVVLTTGYEINNMRYDDVLIKNNVTPVATLGIESNVSLNTVVVTVNGVSNVYELSGEATSEGLYKYTLNIIFQENSSGGFFVTIEYSYEDTYGKMTCIVVLMPELEFTRSE